MGPTLVSQARSDSHCVVRFGSVPFVAFGANLLPYLDFPEGLGEGTHPVLQEAASRVLLTAATIAAPHNGVD